MYVRYIRTYDVYNSPELVSSSRVEFKRWSRPSRVEYFYPEKVQTDVLTDECPLRRAARTTLSRALISYARLRHSCVSRPPLFSSPRPSSSLLLLLLFFFSRDLATKINNCYGQDCTPERGP